MPAVAPLKWLFRQVRGSAHGAGPGAHMLHLSVQHTYLTRLGRSLASRLCAAGCRVKSFASHVKQRRRRGAQNKIIHVHNTHHTVSHGAGVTRWCWAQLGVRLALSRTIVGRVPGPHATTPSRRPGMQTFLPHVASSQTCLAAGRPVLQEDSARQAVGTRLPASPHQPVPARFLKTLGRPQTCSSFRQASRSAGA